MSSDSVLRSGLQVLWRRKYVGLLTAISALVVVLLGTSLVTPVYVASATIRVSTASGGTVDYAEYMYATRLMNTYAQIATSRPVQEELARSLGLAAAPKVSVAVLADTELMRLTVESADPEVAANAANALVQVLMARTREIYSGAGRSAQEILGEQLTQAEAELTQARLRLDALLDQTPVPADQVSTLSQNIELKERTYAMLLEQYEQARLRESLRANTLSVVEAATAPRSPARPSMTLNAILALGLGLVGGVGVSFLAEHLDTTVASAERIAQVTQMPLLGTIPLARRQRRERLLQTTRAQDEAFRHLRTGVLAWIRSEPSPVLAVTSPRPGDGKSSVVANLARAMALSGRTVVVVDADLRRPVLHRVFDVPNETGLSTVLSQDAPLSHSLQKTDLRGITVLPSGPVPPNPSELLGQPRMRLLLDELTRDYDIVLVDTPALLSVADAAEVAPQADGVLLVVARQRTPEAAVLEARRRLERIRAGASALVVTWAEPDGRQYY